MRGATVLDPPVPPKQSSDGGGDSRWVALTKARHDIDAHLLIGRLEEAGIEARLLKDRAAPGAWLYGGSNPWAPVYVLVRKLDLDDAQIVLAEISYASPSRRVETPEEKRAFRRASVLWWVTAIAIGAALGVLVLDQTVRSTSFCQLPVLCEESGSHL